MTSPNPQDKPESQPALAASAGSASDELAAVKAENERLKDIVRRCNADWFRLRDYITATNGPTEACRFWDVSKKRKGVEIFIGYITSLWDEIDKRKTPNDQSACSAATDEACPSCFGNGIQTNYGTGNMHGLIERCEWCGGTGRRPVTPNDQSACSAADQPVGVAARECDGVAAMIDVRAGRATEADHQSGQYGNWCHDSDILRMAARILRREVSTPNDKDQP